MASGALVDDATMAEVVRDRLAKPDAAARASCSTAIRGRSPRPRRWRGSSATPARTLDAVLLVEVPEDELVRRALLRGRADDQEERDPRASAGLPGKNRAP